MIAPILLTADAKLAIERYTANRVEAMRSGDDSHMYADARSYAVEALIAILRANPETFDFAARMAEADPRRTL